MLTGNDGKNRIERSRSNSMFLVFLEDGKNITTITINNRLGSN
jgi:hypothetical protein